MKRLILSITLASMACWPAMDVDVRLAELQLRGTPDIVRSYGDFISPRAVPGQWQHLVDWHAGTDPVVLLFSASGRACAITQWQAYDVTIGHPFRCAWRVAR